MKSSPADGRHSALGLIQLTLSHSDCARRALVRFPNPKAKAKASEAAWNVNKRRRGDETLVTRVPLRMGVTPPWASVAH